MKWTRSGVGLELRASGMGGRVGGGRLQSGFWPPSPLPPATGSRPGLIWELPPSPDPWSAFCGVARLRLAPSFDFHSSDCVLPLDWGGLLKPFHQTTRVQIAAKAPLHHLSCLSSHIPQILTTNCNCTKRIIWIQNFSLSRTQSNILPLLWMSFQ